MAKKVGVGDGCTMTSLNTSYDPALRAGKFATSDKIDPVSKDGSGHRQPAISEQIFCLDVKRIFSILGCMWTELLYFDLDSSVLVFLTISAMCSVGFYSVPILLELHVLVSFRVRSSQLPSTIKAE